MSRFLRTPRARCFTAGAIGAAPAVLIFAWFAAVGRLDLFRGETLGDFYEVQARSWLHRRWDAGPGDYFIERFNVNGRIFTYFGPAPALLRVPFVLFTRSLDGRLSRVSMILAFAILLGAATAITWQARRVLRGGGMPTRAALVATGGFVFVCGCGTTALFLAAKTWVYSEAILWGAAMAVTSFAFLIAYLLDGKTWLLVGAGATATLSFLSRGSVGIGPVAALGILLGTRVVAWAWGRLRGTDRPNPLRFLGLGPSGDNRRWWPVAVAFAVPVILYAYVNHVKFGTFFGTPPYELQDELAARPSRVAALAANDGSLFGIHYAPTIALAYLRPDAITIDRLFPWVSFAGPPTIVGDATFEAANFSAAVTVTSLVFTVLVALGLWAAVRAPRVVDDAGSTDAPQPTASVFRVPILGAAFGCVGMFLLAFIDERYLGDALPLLVVAGALGLWWVAHLLTGRSRTVRTVVIAALVVVAAWSVWATASLTYLEQREFSPLVSRETQAELIDLQLDLHDVLPGGTPSRVVRGGPTLPEAGRVGTFYVVGDCDGLYWSNGRDWRAIEQTPRTGRVQLRVALDDMPAGTREPLLSAEDDRGASIIWVEHLGDGEVQLDYQWTGTDQTLIEGVSPDVERVGSRTSAPFRVPERGIELAVRLDPDGYVGVLSGDTMILSTFAPVAAPPARLGVQDAVTDGATELSGTITPRRPATPLCDRITGTA